jgi:hypothetical protein
MRCNMIAMQKMHFVTPECYIPYVPLEVLQRRTIPSANGFLEQGLIHCSGWSREMATWENITHLRQTFPCTLLGVKQVLKSRGMLAVLLLVSQRGKQPMGRRREHA